MRRLLVVQVDEALQEVGAGPGVARVFLGGEAAWRLYISNVEVQQ